MEDTLYTHIMLHCSMMDQITRLTEGIREAGLAGDLDRVVSLSENKSRAINALSHMQSKIEKIIASFQGPVPEEAMLALRAWADDFAAINARWNETDAITSAVLEAERQRTTTDIAAVFKAKEKHKGYGLGSVKK